ncbi:MAG: cobalamin-dependent protein [Deltaproteobacteria bacterium]|nr:cobalamin-dependent protein [Deltaproteobacteria bacterium]
MKVHLIFAPTTYQLNPGDLGKGIDPPLGILYIAAYLRQYGSSGITIKASDGMLLGYEKTLEAILAEGADIVGLSTVTPNALGAYRLAKEIRVRMPNTRIIFGGPHSTALPEEIFSRSTADAVVIGEGEQTFLELVEYYRGGNDAEKLENIRGIAYIRDGSLFHTPARPFISDLDTIPFPDRHLLDMKQYSGYPLSKARPSTTILISRGCPFKCTFCSNNVWRCGSPLYRYRSPENVVSELKMLKNDGYKEFFDNSDEFNTGLTRSKQLLRAIIDADLKIFLKCQVRASPIDDELAELMRRAGVWYLHLGIESGNPETLSGIRKKISLQEVERCCRLLKNQGIKIWGLFMYFNIWEENGILRIEDMPSSFRTFEYAKHLLKLGLIDFFGGSITTPYPGSALWDIVERHGLIKPECIGNWDMWFYKRELRLISVFPGVPEADIFKLHQKTVKYTAWSLLKARVVDVHNIPFTLRRTFYFLKRAFWHIFRQILR